MPGFFADSAATHLIELPDDGTRIVLRQYVDAGIEEDLANEMVRLKIRGGNNRGAVNGSIDPHADAGETETEAQVRVGTLHLIQKMLLRVEFPEGHPRFPKGRIFTAPIGMGLIREMHPAVRTLIKRAINQYNPDYELPLEPTKSGIVD